MSSLSCVNKFTNFRIETDKRLYDARIDRNLLVPIIRSIGLPPPTLPGRGGAIAYDEITQRMYYSDGYTWLPIGSGAPGTVDSYSFIKNGDQTILPLTPTTLTNWTIVGSPAYHTIPGWNLTTGIYTASIKEVLTVEIDVSWAKGISNLGDRTLRIEMKIFPAILWTIIKEVRTQADPKTNVETTQEATIHVEMQPNDQIRIVVEHDAPVSLDIEENEATSISGFRVNVI